MKTDDITAVITALCEQGARAVSRYVEISGLDPEAMPEYFMPAFVLDHMGDQVTMTLETNFMSLIEWNMHSKTGRRALPSFEDIKALSLAANIGAPRIDLVMFADPHRRKTSRTFLPWSNSRRVGSAPRAAIATSCYSCSITSPRANMASCADGPTSPKSPGRGGERQRDLWFERGFELVTAGTVLRSRLRSERNAGARRARRRWPPNPSRRT